MAGILPFLTEKHLNVLFLIGASLVVIGMPYSLLLMSIGNIWISSVYILEGGYRQKLQALKHPLVVSILLFFLLFLVGLIWSTDVNQGLKEIKKVLPFLSIPVVFSGISSVTKKQKEGLMWLFVTATLSSILVIYIISYTRGTMSSPDPRDISIFTSHIRLSLFISLGISWVIFYPIRWWIKLLLIVPLISFIVVVQSLTGVTVLFCIVIATVVGILHLKKVSSLKWLRLITISAVIFGMSFLIFTIYDFYHVENPNETPELTENGNKYNPELENGFIENGGYLWSYVSHKELEVSFKEKTGKSIWDIGADGYSYYGVTIRYLNNYGYTKDAAGIGKLAPKDFERIMEANPYPDHWKYRGFSIRIRGLLFHIEKSRYSPDFRGNSLAEKVVFQTAGANAYMANPIIGAGTGDLKGELGKYYAEHFPDLPENLRRKPHNQYLTYLIMFGPVGLLLFLAIFYFAWKSVAGNYQNVGRAFVIIVLLSFLGEDTVASQAGITFVSFFIGILFLLKVSDE